MSQRASLALSVTVALAFAGWLLIARDSVAPAYASGGPPEHVEARIEQATEKAVERAAEQAVERAVQRAAERAAERSLEKAAEKAAERAAHGLARATANAFGNGAAAVLNAAPADGRRPDDPGTFREGADENGHGIVLGEMLLLVDQRRLAALVEGGVHIISARELPGLDLVLVRISTLGAPDIGEILDAVGGPEFTIDHNHVYRPGMQGGGISFKGAHAPADYFDFSSQIDRPAVKLGVIDTGVDIEHPVFASARIVRKDFVAYAHERPMAHGTAVASILVGDSAGYRGLMPHAALYSASVFFKDGDGADAATTASLVEALDWLAASNVPVVNMSLTGPPNAVLQAAIRKAWEKGIIIVAAAGNGGPAAGPIFPAAYDEVVSITAIDGSRSIYRLANRGDYVDFSAPGVNILCASPGAKYEARSGTSIAAPFAAAILAEAGVEPRTHSASNALLRRMRDNAQDLGQSGFDPVYGYGLIRRFPTL